MEDATATKILNTLTEQRVAPFKAHFGTSQDALVAYEWSLSLGQALLKPIGIVEVSVRNAVDCSLSAWWHEQGREGTWIDTCDSGMPIPFLDPFVHAAEWRRRAKSNKRDREVTVTHDDVIAHTSLGTWRNMIGNPAAIPFESPSDPQRRSSWQATRRQDALCAELWNRVLKNAFLYIPKTKRLRLGMSPRAYVGARLTRTSQLRNRICHWDNLLCVDIEARYDDLKRLAGAIDPDIGAWLCSQCDEEVKKLIEQKPIPSAHPEAKDTSTRDNKSTRPLENHQPHD